MRDDKRVVVTGIGFLSPLGNSIEQLEWALQNNQSGIQPMPEWDGIENLRTRVAGVCRDVDEYLIPRTCRRTMGRVALLAALSARSAMLDAGLEAEAAASPACGVSFGSTEGSTGAMDEFLQKTFTKKSLKGLQSSGYFKIMSHTCAANLAVMLKTQGPMIASCTACVSGSQGIGFGYEAIRRGQADLMFAGGAEEMHFLDGVIFDIMRATSSRYNDSPASTPRPFDRDRDGLVVSEGGACLLLEEYEHARKRNARIYAEVIGFGNSCDGSHLTYPSVGGLASTMRLALRDAGIGPDAVDHINAHATGTRVGDTAESHAIHEVFGDQTPVTGFKGFMGHTLGACGCLESIITILMMQHSFISPTRNLENVDPDCAPIHYIRGETRQANVSIGMNNNFAFGGVNTALIFSLI